MDLRFNIDDYIEHTARLERQLIYLRVKFKFGKSSIEDEVEISRLEKELKRAKAIQLEQSIKIEMAKRGDLNDELWGTF